MKKLLINESVVNYKVILKTGEIKNLRGVMEYANESIKGILCISTKKDGFFEIEIDKIDKIEVTKKEILKIEEDKISKEDTDLEIERRIKYR